MPYDKEIDPAQKMFWDRVYEDVKNSTSRKILVKLEEVSAIVKKSSGRGRFLLNAISHGFGVFKSEADKLFKD